MRILDGAQSSREVLGWCWGGLGKRWDGLRRVGKALEGAEWSLCDRFRQDGRMDKWTFSCVLQDIDFCVTALHQLLDNSLHKRKDNADH